jgi:hypothetical protein
LIPISETELRDLANKRAKNIQEKIAGSGKVEPERLSLLATPESGATNHNARLYFQLK